MSALVSALEALAWPSDRVAEAIALVARHGGLPLDGAGASARATPASVRTREALTQWAMTSAQQLGLSAELVHCPYRELDVALRSMGPALVALPGDDERPRFLAIVRGGRVVAPDGRVHRRRQAELRAAIAAPIEQRATALGEVLDAAGLGSRQRARVERALVAQRHGGAPLGPFLVLSPHPGASLGGQLAHAGLPRAAAGLLAAHLARTAAVLLAWALLGRGALSGRLELGWLFGWAMALATTVPLGGLASYAQGRFAIAAGRLMKQRLLAGLLGLPQDAARAEGAGGLLGRVLESTAIESLVLGGSLGALLGLVELAVAGAVLWRGAGGLLSLGLLLTHTAVGVLLARRLYVRTRRATDLRLDMTHDLVEKMVGHRTRLAQEPPEEWHLDEDRALERYLGRVEERDRGASIAAQLLPRAWLVVGALGLAPAFVGGASGASIAIGVGGVLLGLSAFTSLVGGLEQLVLAAVAWRRAQPLFASAAPERGPGDVESMLAEVELDPRRPVLAARELAFRYPGREQAVVQGCTLALAPGDRVLLEGASGGGKSTLAALLGGLRSPSAGVLLLEGLDLASLGSDAWRRRVVTVPQFHENHVFSASFGFNALMGAEWPPSPEQLEELRALCEELGLGPLIERMPAGLEQMVGDQGWQLSHGERSRLFIARALLQKEARVCILDESFAALDPVTLERCVHTVLRRVRTLIVIAHP